MTKTYHGWVIAVPNLDTMLGVYFYEHDWRREYEPMAVRTAVFNTRAQARAAAKWVRTNSQYRRCVVRKVVVTIEEVKA